MFGNFFVLDCRARSFGLAWLYDENDIVNGGCYGGVRLSMVEHGSK